MNVNNNPVQRFFKETLPRAAHTAKTRIKSALNAIQNPKEYSSKQKIHATTTPIILTPRQLKMQQALDNAESLDMFIEWAQNPDTYNDLQKVSQVRPNKLHKDDLVILKDPNHAFDRRNDPKMLSKIINFTDFVKILERMRLTK